MQHEVLGKIIEVLDVTSGETKKGDEWKKISFILKTSDDYNNLYPFDVFGSGEHASKVDNFQKYNKVGDEVKVTFNVNANEYNGKYYTNLSAWRVDNQKGASNNSSSKSLQEDDDMPF